MKNIWKWTTTFIVFFIIIGLLYGTKTSLDLVNGMRLSSEQLHLEVNQSYFVAPVGSFSENDLKEIQAKMVATNFNQSQIDFGQFEVWYELKLRNIKNVSIDLVILFDNPMLDYIDVFSVEEQGLVALAQLGDKRQSTLELMALPNIDLSLAPKSSKTLIIKTSTLGTPNMPIAMFKEQDFEHYRTTLYLIWGSFIGIVLLMAVYNVILFLGVKDNLYIVYVAYIGVFLVVLGVVHGFLVYLLPYAVYDVIADKIIVLFCFVAITMLSFAIRFLKFDVELPNPVFNLAKYLTFALVGLSIFAVFVEEYQAAQIFFALQGVVYLLAIVIVSMRLKQDFGWAKYYVVSWLPLFIGAAVGPLMLTGNLEYSFWTRHALLFGVLFEMTFISMALAERLRTSENKKLYQATHDQFLDIGNISILEDVLKEHFRQDKLATFSLITLKIDNFHMLTPYLDAESLKRVLIEFIKSLEAFFLKRVSLQELVDDTDCKHIVTIKDGYFSFIVLSSDMRLLKQLKSDFNQFVPFSYRLPGFNVSFNCLCCCVSSSGFDSSDELLNHSFRSLLELDRSKVAFLIVDKEEGAPVKEAEKTGQLADLHISFRSIVAGDSGALLAVKVLTDLTGYATQSQLQFPLAAESQSFLRQRNERLFRMVCEKINTIGGSDIRFVLDFTSSGYFSKGVISFLINTLNDTGVRADRFILKVEISGTTAANVETLFVLQELVELGFELCIDADDFGLANFNWLSDIKISFVEFRIRSVLKLLNNSKGHSDLVALVEHFNHLSVKMLVSGVRLASELEKIKGLNIGLSGEIVGQAFSEVELNDFSDQHHLDKLAKLNDLEYEQAVELETLKRHARVDGKPLGAQ